MSEHVARLWPELLDMESTLHRLTERPHVIATKSVDDPTHVERIVDQRLARREREQEIDERMDWR